MTQNTLEESSYSLFKTDLAEPVPGPIRSRDDMLALFSTERSLRALKSAAADGSRLLARVADLCGILSHKKKVCCLLDWDVLRTYLEMGPIGSRRNTSDALLTEVFFEHGRIPYAFPLGAFEELLEHLARKRAGRVARPVSSTRTGDLSGEEAFAELFLAVADQPVDNRMTIDQQFSELESHVDGDFEVLRLVAVMKNKRFTGVRAKFVAEDVEKWTTLQQMENPSRRTTRNFHRDALNLSIALYELVHVTLLQDRGPVDEGLVLLTQTERLYGLLSHLNNNSNMRAYARQVFGGSLEDYSEKFNVIASRDFALVEWFGDASTPERIRQTEEKAKQYRRPYADFEFNLDEELRTLDSQSYHNQRETLDYLAMARKNRLIGVMKEVIETHSELQRIQRRRALLNQVERTQVRWHDACVEDEASEQELITQGRLWSQVEIILGEQAGINYDVTIDWPKLNEPFARFSVNQIPTISNQLIFGELQYSEHALLPDAALVSWPTLCLEDDFADALRQLLQVAKTPQALDRSTRAMEEAVLILADGTEFHFNLIDLASDWSWINAGRLRRFLRDKQVNSEHADVALLWIRLTHCSIAYEYVPEAGSSLRKISFHTRYNLGSLAAQLIAQTSPTFYLTQPLASVLRQLLSPLPTLKLR